MRVGIGILLAALAAYIWGFLYWGVLGPAYATWQSVESDEAVMNVLRENFPRDGTYFLPGRNHDEATTARLFEQGPVAMVHMLDREGRPMMDPSIMLLGFLHYIVAAALLAILLSIAGVRRSRAIKLSASVALFAVVMIHVGDSVWWQIPWAWKLSQAAYDFIAILIMGATLSRFLAPRAA